MKIFITTLLLTSSIQAADFGNEIIDDYLAKYKCRYLDSCNVPSISDVENLEEEFKEFQGTRISTLEKEVYSLQQKKNYIQEQADDFYNQVGDNVFSTAYSGLSEAVTNSSSYKELERLVQLFSDDSEVLSVISELREIVESDDESRVRKYYHFFHGNLNILKDYALSLRSLSRDFSRYSADDAIKYISFDFDQVLTKSGCKYVDISLSSTSDVLDHYPFNADGLHAIENIKAYKMILHGQNSKALNIECKEVGTLSSLKPSYNKAQNKLTIPYKKGFRVNWPGPTHSRISIVRPLLSASKQKLINSIVNP